MLRPAGYYKLKSKFSTYHKSDELCKFVDSTSFIIFKKFLIFFNIVRLNILCRTYGTYMFFVIVYSTNI